MKQPMTAYKCLSCKWTAQSTVGLLVCPRCMARDVQPVSKDELLQALDAHDVEFCRACNVIHTR